MEWRDRWLLPEYFKSKGHGWPNRNNFGNQDFFNNFEGTRWAWMVTERERMLAGELYDAGDAELVEARIIARERCQQINASLPRDEAFRRVLTRKLFASGGDSVQLEPPFRCDYGTNIHLGQNVYFNFDCVVLDVCEVRIGDFVFFGPGVHVYTASHPLDAGPRRTQEFGKPVTIGSDVWIGGKAVICPGVSIGQRSVIGAGSVVTKDVPDGVVVAGNPAKLIRRID
ncbi:Maa (Maltose O-acetyltransferase) [Rhodopirellula baltica SH28]|uniref:Maa (Maltose O-acetyltransferase) n=2 Tax=Rhodopirellula baltica TaxID=265606 RepID=K5D2G5_RHOBT|nr:Maa (Maltose O-acetyltransferase) [Rhodopirellula baltica SH28]